VADDLEALCGATVGFNHVSGSRMAGLEFDHRNAARERTDLIRAEPRAVDFSDKKKLFGLTLMGDPQIDEHQTASREVIDFMVERKGLQDNGEQDAGVDHAGIRNIVGDGDLTTRRVVAEGMEAAAELVHP